jgi:polysaccharide pyruvyl transferase WcaK-like protein
MLPDYTIEQVEIRRLYKNYKHNDKLVFDESFIAYANSFDFFIIGGGGFLDYWVEGSRTGTTLDIAPSLIKKIKVPTLITSVGCMPNKPVPAGNIEKFRFFLDELLSNPNIKLAVRNDGSILSIQEEIGEHYLEHIPEVVDSGFFYNPTGTVDLPIRRAYAAVNITADQLQMAKLKYPSFNTENYYQQLAKTVEYLILEQNLDVVFVPHIFSDFEAITALSKRLDDFMVRNHVSVAPYLQSISGANFLFSVYRDSKLVIGSRFHANVCSLAMGKNVIGLALMDRLSYIFNSLKIPDRSVYPEGDFSEFLFDRSSEDYYKLSESQELTDLINNKKQYTIRLYEHVFKDLSTTGSSFR